MKWLRSLAPQLLAWTPGGSLGTGGRPGSLSLPLPEPLSCPTPNEGRTVPLKSQVLCLLKAQLLNGKGLIPFSARSLSSPCSQRPPPAPGLLPRASRRLCLSLHLSLPPWLRLLSFLCLCSRLPVSRFLCVAAPPSQTKPARQHQPPSACAPPEPRGRGRSPEGGAGAVGAGAGGRGGRRLHVGQPGSGAGPRRSPAPAASAHVTQG